MIREKEIEIRTDEKKMLICTIEVAEDGHVDLITRDRKKEDRISVDRFLTKVFCQRDMIMSS